MYLTIVDGRPASAAALFVQHGIGHLANASTMPGYRGLGCQTALINRRPRDATAAGCSRACVVAAWDSQSHRNLARAGFTAAYTKAVWRFGERDAHPLTCQSRQMVIVDYPLPMSAAPEIGPARR